MTVLRKLKKRLFNPVFRQMRHLWQNCLGTYYRLHKPVYGLNTTEKRDKKIIISLTSFPARFSSLHICIKTLLMQTVKPDMVILYLGKDCDGCTLPQSLLALKEYGLTIKTGYEDIRPHKKYVYAMQEYPEDIVITADDDLLYAPDMVQSLMNSYRSYPHAVSARRVHLITGTEKGLQPYNEWLFTYKGCTEPSMSLFSTNGAGSLFPPHIFPAEAFNIEKIKSLCLNADDVWIKFMLIKNNVPVVWVPSNCSMPFAVPTSQKETLSSRNTLLSHNDAYIAAMQAAYHISLAEYCVRQSR